MSLHDRPVRARPLAAYPLLIAALAACKLDASGTGGSEDDTGDATTGPSTTTSDPTTTPTGDATSDSTATDAMVDSTGATDPPPTTTDATTSTDTGIPGQWWDVSFMKRRRITLALPEGVVGPLDHVPVPISIDDTVVNYDELQERGQDLRFVDADDQTPLPFEIERWNPDGTSLVWVSIPEFDANDSIYMYWNNPGAPPGQNPGGVWAVGYGGVYHLSDDPESKFGLYRDSSPGDRHASPQGNMTTDDRVAGLLAAAIEFDGADDAAAITTLDTDDWTAITVSAWIYRTGDGDDAIVSKAFDSTPNNHVFTLRVEGGSLRARLRTDGEGQASADLPGPFVPQDTWTHVAMVWSTTDAELVMYVDGVEVTSVVQDGQTLFNDNADTLIANAVSGQDHHFPGILDEVRVEHDARSADWIRTQVVAARDGLATFEAEETVP